MIILLAIPPVKPQSNGSITLEEKQTETPKSPRVFRTLCYEDNTIVLQIHRANAIVSNNLP